MNTMLTERQRILVETTEARDKAQSLLAGLLDARTGSESRLTQLNQSDMLKRVTGASSMDNAIESTRRMIDTLNRALDQFRRELTDEDLSLLETE